MHRTLLLLSAALACEAFAPLRLVPTASRRMHALSAPASRGRGINRSGAIHTRAHIDPAHAFSMADTFQVGGFKIILLAKCLL